MPSHSSGQFLGLSDPFWDLLSAAGSTGVRQRSGLARDSPSGWAGLGRLPGMIPSGPRQGCFVRPRAVPALPGEGEGNPGRSGVCPAPRDGNLEVFTPPLSRSIASLSLLLSRDSDSGHTDRQGFILRELCQDSGRCWHLQRLSPPWLRCDPRDAFGMSCGTRAVCGHYSKLQGSTAALPRTTQCTNIRELGHYPILSHQTAPA